MKILVIDGQNGRLGSQVIESIKSTVSASENGDFEIIAVGTNALATSTMLKSGADKGATGENPVIVQAREADVIVGPIGIVMADSLLGEITEKMAASVGRSNAKKILIPVNQCQTIIAGTEKLTRNQLIDEAVSLIFDDKTCS